ncbi:MAG: 3-isopropylmalate dehydrogenase [Gammaproteobacteria bacterium]
MSKNIAVLAGDGIGQEVMPQALKVLDAIQKKFSFSLQYHQGLIGGAAYDEFGEHFPQATKALCQQCDGILLGSVGGPINEAHLPKWKNCEVNALLALRKLFELSTNLRPVRMYTGLEASSPLRLERLIDVDILFVRELVGDIYFGEHKRFIEAGKRVATDQAYYDETQIITVARQAFDAAKLRGHKVTSVDKANVLDTSKLWREVLMEVGRDYPDVELNHMLVDNCAMQLLLNPSQFDVIVTANLFGDILSDLASAIPGSLGLLPSASLNLKGFGLYEPSGGSAPDIAGKNIANPIAQILSSAMMLRYSFAQEQAANAIEQAVNRSLQAGYCTQDIYVEGRQCLGTEEMTEKIIEEINNPSLG